MGVILEEAGPRERFTLFISFDKSVIYQVCLFKIECVKLISILLALTFFRYVLF